MAHHRHETGSQVTQVGWVDMKNKTIGMAAAAGLLIGTTGCGGSGPQEILSEEEIASVLPTGEAAPGGLELAEESEISTESDPREDWEAETEEIVSSLSNQQESIEDQPGAEECLTAQEETLEAFRQMLEDVDEDTDYLENRALADYVHESGAHVAVHAYSFHPDTWQGADTWLQESLACMTIEGGGHQLAEEIEETEIGDTIGYQARLTDGDAPWETILHDGIDYLGVDVIVDHDEPLDDDLSEDLEALYEHILEEAEAIEH